jgi:hypothetical protein
MRIGLITDIHTHAAELAAVLRGLQARGTDEILCLGDTIDAFAPSQDAEAVAELLDGVQASGVWGNHDFGLAQDPPSPRLRERFSPRVFATLARMRPSLTREGYHFSHREATLDPSDITQLWSIDEDGADLLAVARTALERLPRRGHFLGHHHRWWAATKEGSLDWQGERVLELPREQPAFVILAPVFLGFGAILDTLHQTVEPISL